MAKFYCLKLFGFFEILERVRRVGSPIFGQVDLFPDDSYEINIFMYLVPPGPITKYIYIMAGIIKIQHSRLGSFGH